MVVFDFEGKDNCIVVDDYGVEYGGVLTGGQSRLSSSGSGGFVSKFFYGDNLCVLDYLLNDEGMVREIQENGGVKLIYIDPPYNTGRVFKNKDGCVCYSDSFGGVDGYLSFLYPRLVLAHRLLASDGSIYVHVDYRVSSYVKLLLDEIFGVENYRNEIVWHYSTYQGRVRNYFPRKHDTILYYTKSDKYCFHLLKDNNPEQTIDFTRWNKYLNSDNQIMGDYYPKNDSRFKGYYNRFVKKYHRKPCKDDVILEIEGNTIDSVWDIKSVDPKNKKERLGYPTQKPLVLLERIIKASTNPSDIVLDFFAGSGTALECASNLGRKWIGVDSSEVSYGTVVDRLKSVDGVKFDVYEIVKS